jgi:hypothetical protein
VFPGVYGMQAGCADTVGRFRVEAILAGKMHMEHDTFSKRPPDTHALTCLPPDLPPAPATLCPPLTPTHAILEPGSWSGIPPTGAC